MKYILFATIVFISFGCATKQNESTSSLSKVKLETLDGQPIDLSDYKGKTIFLNFWATWCGPCLQEMPSIEKAMADLKGEDIVFLFASEEEADLIKSFKAARPFNFKYLRVLNVTELDIQALPTTFIFNKEGNLVFNEIGYRDWSKDENKNLILSNAKEK